MQEVRQGADAMLQNQQAKLVLSLPEPDIVILGNKTALVGALQNLIHNALTVKPHNALINIIASCQSDNPDWVNLSVTDNGPGIKSEHIKSIFDPFFTTKSNGTGLGLAVVKSVAQSHQGNVQVTNLVDGGACFTLCLPTYDANHATQQVIAATNQPIVPTQTAQPQPFFANMAGS